jgi:GT2 family glycosyltransferase
MKPLAISIIIPNFNGAHFLTDCLSSLSTSLQNCPNTNFEIILVDNGSTDNSLFLVKDYKLKIIQNSSNLGFAAAVNQGIMASKYPYVCLLNNDLTLDPNWFKYVTTVIKENPNSKITTFCGTILNKEGTKYESQGLSFEYRGKCTNISNNQPYSSKALMLQSSPRLIWGSSAALVVYQKDIIQPIGLFDEDFFAYEEDVDLALRLDKLGYKTLYVPPAISYHLGGGTSNKMGNFRHIHDSKNWIFIIIKNYSFLDFKNNLLGIIEQRFRNLSGLIKNTPIILIPSSLWYSYSPIILKFPKILTKRRQFQNLLKSNQ